LLKIYIFLLVSRPGEESDFHMVVEVCVPLTFFSYENKIFHFPLFIN